MASERIIENLPDCRQETASPRRSEVHMAIAPKAVSLASSPAFESTVPLACDARDLVDLALSVGDGQGWVVFEQLKYRRGFGGRADRDVLAGDGRFG